MFTFTGRRQGKSRATLLGAIQGASRGASVALITNDVNSTMSRLCDELSETKFNYYATSDEIILEGRGDIRVSTGTAP